MSALFWINVLNFNDVTKQLRTTFETLSDRRTGKHTTKTQTLLSRMHGSIGLKS